MTLTKQHTRAFISALELKAETTQETYFVLVDGFLKTTGGNISRESVIKYLKLLNKNSILTAYYAIKFFYRSAGLPFDISRSDIAPSGVKRLTPVLSQDDVAKLIHNSKSKFGTIEIGYIALSTVYGMRRVEIYNIEAEHIDIDGRALLVTPVKILGTVRERQHVIPEEIVEYLFDMQDGLKKVRSKPAVTALNRLFDAMCIDSGIEKTRWLGLHSIRRALASGLFTNGLDYTLVKDFMRWKERASDMPAHYLRDWKLVDTKVFEKHPFLKEWSDEKSINIS